jgi:multidrug resistance efflux pump
MNKRLKGIALVSGIFAAAVFVLAGFFVWRNAAYVDTFHARVLGDATVATVPANGRVLQYDVEVGDAVAEGEELGIIEVYLSSSPGGRVALPVRAPVSGVIVERRVGVSEAVAAGQPLVTIMDPNDMWVEANINEARIAQVKVGQDVRVRVRALKVSFSGRVERVGRTTNVALTADGGRSAVSQAMSAEVPVRIAFDPDGYRLMPGMSVEVRIRIDPRAW